MSQKKIKITFILPSLAAGGAERVLSFIVQHLDSKKFKVTFLIVGFQSDTVYDTGNVELIYLNKNRIINGISGMVKHIKKHKPDIVLSSIVHLNIVVGFISYIVSKTKFLARESSILSQNTDSGIKAKISNALVKKAYSRFDAIICQSKDMMLDLIQSYKIPEDKLIIINNPITETFKVNSVLKPKGTKLNIITVGRITEIKGHKRLLGILSKVEFDFSYTIIGDGSYNDLLESINSLGLANKIKHIPYTTNIYEHLSNSDLFLQGSYSEGFPNALLESCVSGTPGIVFNIPGGTKEIIEHGVNGYIAKDEDEFLFYLNNFDVNHFNSKTVSESVISKFSKETIITQYENLFLTILKQ